MRGSRGTAALLALLAIVLAGGPPARRALAGEPWPSDEERRQLVRGEVVYRVGAAPRDGEAVAGARGGVAFVRVPTGPEPIWAILTAPRGYPRIFPGLRHVEILQEAPAAWLIRTEGKVGPFEFSYYTRYRVDAPERLLVWRLDRTRDNDVFDDNWGSWRLVPDAGSTLVVYAMGSVPSSWQPLAGFFERRGVVRALGALRDAAMLRPGAALPGGPHP